jgi:GPH family glycoside/pentoside/hexuronide:cation symporter
VVQTKKKGTTGKSMIWSLGAGGGGVFAILLGNLQYALNESFAVSAMATGVIFLLSRLLDGITDVIAGYIIDRTHTKWGKARPYELCNIAAWVCLVFCFSVPGNLSDIGKYIFIFFVYNLANSVFATLSGCAETIRLKRCFEPEARIKANTVSGIVSSLICAVASLALPQMISAFGDKPNGWTIISAALAVPSCVLHLIRFFFLPEILDEEDKKSEKIGFIESIKLFCANKYVILYTLVVCVFTIAISTGALNYYFQYVFGDVGLASVSGIVSLLGIFTVALLPLMSKKLGIRKTAVFTLAFGGVSFALRFFFPDNLAWFSVCTMLTMFGIIPFSYLRSIILIDCMDYGRYKTKKDLEGIYSAIFSVTTKIGLGVGSLLIGFLLQISGYNGTLDTQSSSAVNMIKFLNNGIPAIGFLLCAFMMTFYAVDKYLPEIRKKLSEINN